MLNRRLTLNRRLSDKYFHIIFPLLWDANSWYSKNTLLTLIVISFIYLTNTLLGTYYVPGMVLETK